MRVRMTSAGVTEGRLTWHLTPDSSPDSLHPNLHIPGLNRHSSFSFHPELEPNSNPFRRLVSKFLLLLRDQWSGSVAFLVIKRRENKFGSCKHSLYSLSFRFQDPQIMLRVVQRVSDSKRVSSLTAMTSHFP